MGQEVNGIIGNTRIETDSLLVLRGQNSKSHWCPLDAAEGEMIALENVGVISNQEGVCIGGMAQLRGSVLVARRRSLGTDLPEFTVGPRAAQKDQ